MESVRLNRTPSNMRIKWVNTPYGVRINLDNTATWFVLGVRGSGKSTFLESLAEAHMRRGWGVLDLWGSRDAEGLAWLRSPWVKKMNKKVLLIHGDGVVVDTPKGVMLKHYTELDLMDLEKYDIIISASPLYNLVTGEEYTAVNNVVNLIYQRLNWRKKVFVLIREAANLFYSRIKVKKTQTAAKGDIIYLLREARHFGFTLALDTQKFTSIDIDVRSVVDYHVIKSMGFSKLPDDLSWVYRYLNPNYINRMPPEYFVVVTRTGFLGVGKFDMVPWHKRPTECFVGEEGQDLPCSHALIKVSHMVKEAGKHADEVEGINPKETKMDPDLHVRILQLYEEEYHNQEMVAQKLGISQGTVSNHIKEHNSQYIIKGYCSLCYSVGATELARRVIDTTRFVTKKRKKRFKGIPEEEVAEVHLTPT